MSKQKDLILRLVREAKHHPTAEEIFLAAREEMPRVSVGTVYRNLQQLTEEGRIRKLEMPSGGARYDQVVWDHAHYVCIDCGAVWDTPLPLERAQFAKIPGVSICSLELQVRCRCEACGANH